MQKIEVNILAKYTILSLEEEHDVEVLLCDRGLLDGRAYCDSATWGHVRAVAKLV